MEFDSKILLCRQRLKETEDLVLRGRKESIHLVEKLAETETELATQVQSMWSFGCKISNQSLCCE